MQPHWWQWAVNLRLGIATNGPVVPSMTFKSRTTKASHSHHAPQAVGTQPPGHPPRVPGMMAQPEIRGTTPTHAMSQAVFGGEAPAKPDDPRRQFLGGRLQAIQQQPARLFDVSLPQRVDQRGQGSRPLGRPAHTVNRGGRQPFGRPNDDEIQRPQSRDRLDPFAASTADGRAAGEEKRHVAAEFRGQAGQRVRAEAQVPAEIGGHQCGRRVTGTSAQAGRRRNPLHQPQPGAASHPGPAANQIDRPKHEIPRAARHVLEAESAVPVRRRSPLAFQFDPFAGFLSEVQGIV